MTYWKAWDCWILLYGSCWEALLVVGLLQNKDMDLTEKLEAGFGPDSLGIIAIAEVRLSLLPLRLYLSEYIGGRTYLLEKKYEFVMVMHLYQESEVCLPGIVVHCSRNNLKGSVFIIMSPLFWMLFPLLQWASDKSYIWFQLGLESFSFGFQSKGMWAPLMKKAIICSSLYI